jgi:PAS domain S-box-containing protein
MTAYEQIQQMLASRIDATGSLEDVSVTALLQERPSRPPDYKAENEALTTLAQELGASPGNVLQTLCEIAIGLCRAQSAGVSIEEEVEGVRIFRWRALAGEMAPYLHGIMPRDYAPCGVTIDRNATQLFSRLTLYYPYVQAITPPISEVLLIPFRVEGKPIGTVWIVSSKEECKFDREDARVLTNLSQFAAAAYQMVGSRENLQRTNIQLAAEVTLHKAAVEERYAREEDLARQARLFDTTLSSIVDFAYVFNREGRFTYINQALLDLWQLPLEQAVGKNFFELNYPTDLAARLQQQIETVFLTKQAIRDETPYTGAAGTTGYYEYIFVPIIGTDGQVEAVAGSTRDITARQLEKAERETLLKTLEVERQRLTDIFLRTPAFVAVLQGPQHIFERVNPPYFELVGRRDIIGKPLTEALPEIKGQGFIALLDEVYRTGKPFIGKEIRVFLRKSMGESLEERSLDFVYQPLIEADGSVSGIFVHGVDLTDLRKSTQLLEEKNKEIEALNDRLRQSMMETHHRVKNNLQLISALIDLQRGTEAETVPMSEFVRLGAHVQALGVIHDVLTQDAKTDPQETISVKTVMEKLLSTLQGTLGSSHTLRYRIEDVPLPGRKVISIALLTNELFSNAIKHGKGTVELAFAVHNEQAALEVWDDGAGFAPDFNPVTAANTGLALIDTIARHDLGGEVAYQNRSQGGACVTVRFSLS